MRELLNKGDEKMIRNLYTAGWSMLAKSKQMDVISNNIANVNTSGYKKDSMIFETFSSAMARRINDNNNNGSSNQVGELQLGSDVGQIYTNYSIGALNKTNSEMDMAIDLSPNSFFTVGVRNESGKYDEFYSRDGSFTLDKDGRMITKTGEALMGKDGIIKLSSADFQVYDDGTIMQNGAEVDKIKLVQISNVDTLRKIGNGLITKTAETKEEKFNGAIRQGFLEQSNVNSIKEMVEMINAMRSYEASQKMIQISDANLEKVVNEVGVVR